MQRIDAAGVSASLPTPAAEGATLGYFTEGDAQVGTPATIVSADWLNAIQEELIAVLVRAGITPAKATRTQLRDAIEAIASNGGGGVLAKTFATSGFTATVANKIVTWDTSGGACVQNLPAAATCPGAIFTFALLVAGNNLTITPNGAEKINNDSTMVLSVVYSSARVMSIGTRWILV